MENGRLFLSGRGSCKRMMKNHGAEIRKVNYFRLDEFPGGQECVEEEKRDSEPLGFVHPFAQFGIHESDLTNCQPLQDI